MLNWVFAGYFNSTTLLFFVSARLVVAAFNEFIFVLAHLSRRLTMKAHMVSLYSMGVKPASVCVSIYTFKSK